MRPKLVSATEAARNFSDVLDNVRHHGASYDIRRGRETVARLVPARPAPGSLTVGELAALLHDLPRLAPNDARRFEKDIGDVRRRLRAPRDPWR
jgi:antitoxin (DNA-binding transcriptional repressor) of toxin-antitoxin stability system